MSSNARRYRAQRYGTSGRGHADTPSGRELTTGTRPADQVAGKESWSRLRAPASGGDGGPPARGCSSVGESATDDNAADGRPPRWGSPARAKPRVGEADVTATPRLRPDRPDRPRLGARSGSRFHEVGRSVPRAAGHGCTRRGHRERNAWRLGVAGRADRRPGSHPFTGRPSTSRSGPPLGAVRWCGASAEARHIARCHLSYRKVTPLDTEGRLRLGFVRWAAIQVPTSGSRLK